MPNLVTNRKTILSASSCFLLIALLLAGCSRIPEVPDASDGQKYIEGKIQKQSQGKIRLVSFQKSDGQKQEILGMSLYEMKYVAHIEFLQDCYWGPFPFGEWNGNYYTANAKPNSGYGISPDQWRQISKGHTHELSGTLHFMKRENGWNVKEE